MKVYLAGPLFSAAERAFNLLLADRLRTAGHKVWLPQEAEPRSKSARQIFEKDVEGLDWAEVVVANMDGPDPDSGTCWECGYAYRKKPVIVFRTDFRAGYRILGALREVEEQKEAPFNLMLKESATKHLDLPYQSVDRVADTID